MAGFGILAALWFSRAIWAPLPPERLPGLFDYPSAYLGDSLLIPTAAVLLVAGARALPSVSRERAIAAIGAMVGASSLAALQVLWLVDDHPRRNWTLPAPHRFDLAGAWHAMYSVAIAAPLLAGVIVLLAYRMNSALRVGGEQQARARRLLDGAGATGVLSCLFCYAALAARDSMTSTFGSWATIAELGVAFIVFMALSALVLRRSFVHFWPSILLAVLAAAGLIAIFAVSWQAERTRILGIAQAVVCAVGVALVPLVPGLSGKKTSSGDAVSEYRVYRPSFGNAAIGAAILTAVLPAFWSFAAADLAASHWSWATAWLIGYATAIGAVAVAIVRKGRLVWLSRAADVLLVFILLGAIALVAITLPRWHQASDSAPFSSFIVAIIIARIFFPVLKVRMHAEIRGEQSTARDADGRFGLQGTAKLSATVTAGMLLAAALTAVISLLAFTLAAAIDRKYIGGTGAARGVWLLLAVGVGFVAITVLLGWFKAKAGLTKLAFAAPVATLAWSAALVFSGMHGMSEGWIALIGGTLLALWSANSTLNNAGVLRERPIGCLTWLTAGAAAVSGFTSGVFALSAALASGPSHVYTWFAEISTATAVLVVNGGLSVAAGSIISRTKGQTRHGPVHNLIQDAALMVLLYLIALVIPRFTALHLPSDLDYWDRLVATFAIVGPFLTYFLGPYEWLLTTNLEHLDREGSRPGQRMPTRRELPSRRRDCWLGTRCSCRLLGGGWKDLTTLLSAHPQCTHP